MVHHIRKVLVLLLPSYSPWSSPKKAACPRVNRDLLIAYNEGWLGSEFWHMAVCQNPGTRMVPKIAGKWMFIPLKMVLIGIDSYPYTKNVGNVVNYGGIFSAINQIKILLPIRMPTTALNHGLNQTTRCANRLNHRPKYELNLQNVCLYMFVNNLLFRWCRVCYALSLLSLLSLLSSSSSLSLSLSLSLLLLLLLLF